MKSRVSLSYPRTESGRRLPLLLSALALLIACVYPAAAAASPVSIASHLGQGELVMTYKGRKLLVYTFATNQFKPYVRELYTLRGENVLRDAVPDHAHHHGLMYGICVNGMNFWEEKTLPGVEKHVELPLSLSTIDRRGLPMAEFTELIHWLAWTNRDAADSQAAALLLEKRTLTLTVNEKDQEVALRWDAEFAVGPNAGKVTLHGANYHGLGLRLPTSFDLVAQFQNSEHRPYTAANTLDVIPARWTTVSGEVGGRPVMVAMFGRPENPRGNASFFTMTKAFAYLSATQGLNKQPLEYKSGDQFTLSYLLAIYPENKPEEFIRQRCDLWEKQPK